jgi:hypothetical protein
MQKPFILLTSRIFCACSEATHEQCEDIVIGGSRAAVGMVGSGDDISTAQSEAIPYYVLSEANRVYGELNSAEATAAPDES